jgi:hypothetical protein
MDPTPSSPGTLGRLHRLLRSNWITSTGAALMTLAVFGFVTITAMHMLGGDWAGSRAPPIARASIPSSIAIRTIGTSWDSTLAYSQVSSPHSAGDQKSWTETASRSRRRPRR